MEILVAFFILLCIINIVCWVFKEDSATPPKIPTVNTPLVGDFIKKLCPRQEIYIIRKVEKDGMWILPFVINGRVKRPRAPSTESKYLVWISMEEFNKHFDYDK